MEIYRKSNSRSPDIGLLMPCKIIVFGKAYPEKLMIHILLDFLCLSGVSGLHENTTSTPMLHKSEALCQEF